MEGIGGELGEIIERIQLISPQIFKELLIKFLMFLGVFNLFLLIVTVIHRLWVDLRDRRYNALYNMYSQQLIEALFGEENIRPPRSSLEKEAFGDVCVEIMRKFSGDVAARVRELAYKYGAVEYYLKQANSFIGFTRITAIEKLAFLGVGEIKPLIEKHLEKEKNEWMKWRLSLALALLCENTEDVEKIVKTLGSLKYVSFKFIEFVWFTILRRLEERNALDELINYVRKKFLTEDGEPIVLRAFVEAIGSFRLVNLSSFVMEVYERFKEDSLMRISCIRSLGIMGYEDFCTVFLENYNHKDWRVRAVVAKYAYLCDYETVAEKLKLMMKDENYYVRINAGRALTFFGNRAKEVLKDLLNSEDAFARDTARYLLEELEVKGD